MARGMGLSTFSSSRSASSLAASSGAHGAQFRQVRASVERLGY